MLLVKSESPMKVVLEWNDFVTLNMVLRNFLGDYFVNVDGKTKKPIDQRSQEEKAFAQSLLTTKYKQLWEERAIAKTYW